jgi:hypothetical protein
VSGVGIQIQAIKKVAYLEDIAEDAINSVSTLQEAIATRRKTVFSQTLKTGKVVVSQSGSGQSGSYQMSGNGNDWTPDNILGLVQELLLMVRAADPVLLPDDADPAHTRALRDAIAANIMAGNVPDAVRATQGDFTLLFVPVFGTGLST